MNVSRDKRIERAQMRVLFVTPFFAPGVARLPVVWDERVETAATDGKEIRWNPKWFDTLPDPVVVTVLCHEVGHALFGHLWRAPGGGVDWQDWNIACDHAVNLMLKDFSAQVMAKRLADPFPFPDPQDAYCADPKFAGMAEEVIYNLVHDPKKGQGKQASGAGQASATGNVQSIGSGRKNASGANFERNSTAKTGSMPSFGQMIQPSAGAQGGSKKLKNDWETTLVQACQMAKSCGELPGCVARFADELVNPQVPWQEILRSWLREQCSDDWDFLQPDLTMEESGFILPSLHSEKIGSMVFATDTSRSIDLTLLSQFQTEKQTALDDLRPSRLVDIYCDTKIQKMAEYIVGDMIEKDAPGGGGTSFVPVFKRIEEMAVWPKCVVYLTDLDGEFPKEPPPYPVIWCVWGSDEQAPFGETVRIDRRP